MTITLSARVCYAPRVVIEETDLAQMFSVLWPPPGRRDRQLVAAGEAKVMGHGGVTTVSRGGLRPVATDDN